MQSLIALTFLLSWFAIPALAQTEDVIDARGGSQQTAATLFPAHCGSGGAAWPRPREYTNDSRVRAELFVANADNIVAGQPFEFELVLTNQTATEFDVPRSLEVSEAVNPKLATQQVAEDGIYFELQPTDTDVVNQAPRFTANLSLFSSRAMPSTFVAVGPGESVRIMGRATFVPFSNLHKPESGEMTATLHSYFVMMRTGRRRSKDPKCDGYEFFREEFRTIPSDNGVDITVRWP